MNLRCTIISCMCEQFLRDLIYIVLNDAHVSWIQTHVAKQLKLKSIKMTLSNRLHQLFMK